MAIIRQSREVQGLPYPDEIPYTLGEPSQAPVGDGLSILKIKSGSKQGFVNSLLCAEMWEETEQDNNSFSEN